MAAMNSRNGVTLLRNFSRITLNRNNSSNSLIAAARAKKFDRQFGSVESNRNSNGCGSRRAVLALSVTSVLQYFRTREEENDPFDELKKCQQYIEDGNITRAENILKHTLKRANDDSVSIKSRELLAEIAIERKQFDKAEHLIRENLQEMSRSGYDEENPKLIRTQLKLAKILEQVSRHRDAEKIYQRCMRSIESKVEHSKQENQERDLQNLWLDIIRQYSEYQFSVKNFAEAYKYFEKSYNVCVQVYGETDQRLIPLLSNLGKLTYLMDNLKKSSEYLRKASQIGEIYPDTKELAVVYTYLGNLSLKQGLLKEAETYCDKALDYATRHKVSDYTSEASVCVMNVTNAIR